jgi:hypothetical protein
VAGAGSADAWGPIPSGPPAPGGPQSHSMPGLRVDDLRHPTEASRFALALLASTAVLAVAVFVLISLGRVTWLLLLLLVVAVLIGVVWLSIQLWRVRLLADGVKVSAATLPEVQEVLDAVTGRLGYRRRVDVFVVDKIRNVLAADAPPITLTSLFGVHVIVAEGSALGDLSDDQDRQRLMFILATYVGALKARHSRWGPYLLALDLSGLGKVVFPFVWPWFRATVYTGDRIAYACLEDLDVSLQAVYRTLVGKEVAGHLRAPGLAGQALAVRRTALLRLLQLMRPVPHATNRYLELLAFASSRSEEADAAVRSIIFSSPPGVEDTLVRLRRRRPSVAAIPLAAFLSGSLLLVGLVAGLQARNSSIALFIDEMWSAFTGNTSPSPDVSPSQTPAPYPSPSDTWTPSPPSPSPTPTETASSALTTLWSLVPADVSPDCAASVTSHVGELAALTCQISAAGSPEMVSYFLFDGNSSLQSAFDSLVGDLPRGDCETWNAQTTWSQKETTRGPLACYNSQAGETSVLWADKPTDLLVLAHDPVMAPGDLMAWWRDHARP